MSAAWGELMVRKGKRVLRDPGEALPGALRPLLGAEAPARSAFPLAG